MEGDDVMKIDWAEEVMHTVRSALFYATVIVCVWIIFG